MRILKSSVVPIALFSLFVTFLVLGVGIGLQWIVYNDWLHETGPIRIVGTSIAACIAFAFVFYRLREAQLRQREAEGRFEIIAEMNDKIRNALQTIELLLWTSESAATTQVSDAVDAIDAALKGVVEHTTPVRTRPAHPRTMELAAPHALGNQLPQNSKSTGQGT